MAWLADIVIDCERPALLARFWAAVLDDYEVAPYDDEEIARLGGLGITDLDDDPTVLVIASTGPRIWFQRVPESKTQKNRMHLDVRSDDTLQEANRLIALGAELVERHPDKGLTVMRDPEGNEFCIIG